MEVLCHIGLAVGHEQALLNSIVWHCDKESSRDTVNTTKRVPDIKVAALGKEGESLFVHLKVLRKTEPVVELGYGRREDDR